MKKAKAIIKPLGLESKQNKAKNVLGQACQNSGFRPEITGFFIALPALMSILPAKSKICWHCF